MPERISLSLPSQACEYLQIEEEVGSPRDGVLVNGDSGNDIELFQVPGVMGTMVSNAHPELREWVEKHPSDKIFKVIQVSPYAFAACLKALYGNGVHDLLNKLITLFFIIFWG